MKAKHVLGKDLMIFVGGKAIALAKTMKMTLNGDTIDSSSKDSGIWKEDSVTDLGWDGSSDAVYSVDQSTNGYDVLFDAMVNRELVELVIGVPTNASDEGVPADGWKAPTTGMHKGLAHITSLDLSGDKGDVAKYSVSFGGYGKLERIGTAPQQAEATQQTTKA